MLVTSLRQHNSSNRIDTKTKTAPQPQPSSVYHPQHPHKQSNGVSEQSLEGTIEVEDPEPVATM